MVNKNNFLMQGEKEVGIARFRSSVKTEAPRGIKLPMPKKPRETYVMGCSLKCNAFYEQIGWESQNNSFGENYVNETLFSLL